MKISGWLFALLLSMVLAGQSAAGVRKEVSIWVTGDAAPGTKAIFVVNTTNVASVHVSAHRIKDITKVPSGDYDIIERYVERKPVKEWDIKFGPGHISYGSSQRDIYRHKQTDLSALSPGMYVLTAKGGYEVARALVNITNLSVVVKRSQKQTLVWVTDATKHNVVSGARVALMFANSYSKKNAKGKEVNYYTSRTLTTGITGPDGICIIKNPKAKCNVILVSRGSDQALAGCDDVEGDGELVGHMQTDRPVYRPGQTVNYKAILRLTKGRGYTPVSDTMCRVILKDRNDIAIDESSIKTNALGTFAGSFEIPSEAATGDYSILIKVGKKEDSHSFTVAAYRKPEYKVTVTPAQKRYLSGQNVVFKVNAAYYFGANVQQASVSYQVRQSKVSEWEDPESIEWLADNYKSTYPDDNMKIVSQDQVSTDDSGNASISVKTSPGAPDSVYYITCNVTDSSNREVVEKSKVTVYSAGLKVGVVAGKDLVMIGSNIPIQLKVTDLDGRPAASNITLSTNSLVWDKKAKAYKTKQFSSTTVAVSSKGTAAAIVPAKTEGELVITAIAKDKDGRKTKASASVWVAGIDAKKIDTRKPPKVIVRLNKASYKPGEIIQAFGTTTFADRPLLVTAEGLDVFKYVVIPAGKRTFKWSIPASLDMTPNAFVQATQWSSRKTISDTAKVKITDPSRKLQVKIEPNQQIYRPGAKAEYVIHTLDEHGKPVQAEVSLVAVDESIYAIQSDKTPDLYNTYWGLKPNRVNTSIFSVSDMGNRPFITGGVRVFAFSPGRRYSIHPMMGMPVFHVNGATGKDWQPSPDAYGSVAFLSDYDLTIKSKIGIAPVRQTFADTAFWSAQLTTDKTGASKVSFDLPDNLTKWRVVARAVTSDTRVGTGSTTTQVTRPVTFRLSTPRQFVKGDSLILTGTINNRTNEEHQFIVSISAVGLTIDGEAEQKITITANREGTVQWTVKADSLPENGKAVINGQAYASDVKDTREFSDALQAEVGVVPDGVQNTVLAGGAVGQKVTIPLVLPQDRIEPATTVSINIHAGLAQIIEDLVSSVNDDGMYSPTGPSDILLALSVSNRLNTKRDIREALSAIYARHYGGGGSEYWDTTSDPGLTAVVLTSMQRAKERGIQVNAEVLHNNRQQIKQWLKEENLWERMALLASVGAPYSKSSESYYLTKIHAKGMYLSSFAQLTLAEAYFKQHKEDWARETAAKVLESAVIGPDTAYIPAGERPGWSASTVETTAQALVLLAKLPFREELLPKLAQWLAEESQTAYLSGHEKALAAYALRCYIDKHPQPANLGTPTVAVNGVSLGVVPVKGKSATITVPTGMLKDSGNTIVIERDGLGEVFYSVKARVFVPVSAESRDGMRVLRKYEVQNSSGLWEEMKGSIHTSDHVRCTVVVWPNDRPDVIRVTEPIPSGFEYVESGYSGYSTYEDIRDGAVIHYMTADKDPVFFRYYLRPESEGVFQALPASAEAIRRPAVKGNSEATLFTVKG